MNDTLRCQRLTARHVQFGRSPKDAARWVEVTSEPTARLIASMRERERERERERAQAMVWVGV